MTYLRNIPQTALLTMALLSGCVTSASNHQSAPAVQGGYLQPVPAAPLYNDGNNSAPTFNAPTPGNVNDVPPVPPPAPASDAARLPVSVKSRSMAATEAASNKPADLFN